MLSRRLATGLLAIAILAMAIPATARAHCDSLDGPVVKAARAALEKGDLSLVLIWVSKSDDAEVQVAFERTLAVRKLGPEAKELAELYFFETVVRLHRAAEGEPYTGLKPAGRDLGPVIPVADQALETGELEPLAKLITDAMHSGLVEQYQRAMSLKAFPAGDVEAGREYVSAYVVFMHFAERLYQAAVGAPAGHFEGHSMEEGHTSGE